MAELRPSSREWMTRVSDQAVRALRGCWARRVVRAPGPALPRPRMHASKRALCWYRSHDMPSRGAPHNDQQVAQQADSAAVSPCSCLRRTHWAAGRRPEARRLLRRPTAATLSAPLRLPSPQTAPLPAQRGPNPAQEASPSGGYKPVVTEAWAEPAAGPTFLPNINARVSGSGNGFSAYADVTSPEALRGEARIRGLKNELAAAKNFHAQELMVRACAGRM
jgi:hypothetical protein